MLNIFNLQTLTMEIAVFLLGEVKTCQTELKNEVFNFNLFLTSTHKATKTSIAKTSNEVVQS
jgi:hypothetical protein